MCSSRLLALLVSALLIGAEAAAEKLCAQVEWTRAGEEPVLRPASAGTWDGAGVFSPCVIKDGGELKLWYVGVRSHSPFQSALGFASSLDGGLEWERRQAPVFAPEGGPWENGAINRVSILRDADGRLRMWYSSTAVEPCSIGYAESADGFTWSRSALNPVLRGGVQPWEGTCIDNPSVHFDGTTYRLWYVGGPLAESGFRQWKIGLATSRDGLVWEKYASNPVLSEDTVDLPAGHVGPWVLFDEASESFEMWYSTTHGPPNGAIHFATSMDGIVWTPFEGNPVLPPSFGWDSVNLNQPAILREGDVYKMWYGGNPGDFAATSIGLATAPWSIPKASFTASPRDGDGLAFDFDASKSISPNGAIAAYEWDFGGGERATTATPAAAHRFARPGSYVPKLTVIDGAEKRGAVARGIDARLGPCEVAPWTLADIGAPLYAGSACPAPLPDARQGFEVAAGGKTLTGRSDQLTFLYQELAGDGSITARIHEASGAGERWQVGVMLRQSLDAEAPLLAMVLASEINTVRFKAVGRCAPGGSFTIKNGESIGAPDADEALDGIWVRVARAGGALIASFSRDGENFTEALNLCCEPPQPCQPPLAGVLLAGVAAMGQRNLVEGRFEALLALVEPTIELPPAGLGPFLRGDANGDAAVNIADASFGLNFLFLGGGEPPCKAAADANGDGAVDIADASFTLNFLFLGGREPPAPFPGCGRSAEGGDAALGCAVPSAGCP
jgi:predicted GH43/DUF377 family glycosyl hydrolase